VLSTVIPPEVVAGSLKFAVEESLAVNDQRRLSDSSVQLVEVDVTQADPALPIYDAEITITITGGSNLDVVTSGTSETESLISAAVESGDVTETFEEEIRIFNPEVTITSSNFEPAETIVVKNILPSDAPTSNPSGVPSSNPSFKPSTETAKPTITPIPTKSPTDSPTKILCEDGGNFKYKKGKNKFVRGRCNQVKNFGNPKKKKANKWAKKNKRLCNAETESGDKVKEICVKSCGEAGHGVCKGLED